MGLDLRIPLGLMFLIIGVILLGYGLLTWHSPMYASSLGHNVNVIWGSVMVLFGGTMLLLGMQGRRADRLRPTHGAEAGARNRASH